MRLSNTTILAILATSTFVNAAPTVVEDASKTNTVVKKEDLNEVLDHLAELKNLKSKRDLLEGEELADLEKRADNVLSNLISALANSGLISDVFNTLTSDTQLRSIIGNIVKSTLHAVIVQGPDLIKAIWNSGLLQNIFNKILNDGELRSALLNAGKALFSTAIDLVGKFIGNDNGNGAKRDVMTIADMKEMNEKRENDLEERDLLDIVSFVVQQIKDSGIVSDLINKVMSDPQGAIDFLTSALKTGAVLAGDVYDWSKESGVLQDGIDWLESSDNQIIETLGEFLAGSISSGNVTSEEFDNASGSSTPKATGTADIGEIASDLATVGTTTAAGGSSEATDDLSFLSAYAQDGATTMYRKRAIY